MYKLQDHYIGVDILELEGKKLEEIHVYKGPDKDTVYLLFKGMDKALAIHCPTDGRLKGDGIILGYDTLGYNPIG